MKINEYINLVKVINISQDIIEVKLITENGNDCGSTPLVLKIPTSNIPPDKRKYGAIFKLKWKNIKPENDDNIKDIRQASQELYQDI